MALSDGKKSEITAKQQWINRVADRLRKKVAEKAQREHDQVTLVEVFGMTAEEVDKKINEYKTFAIALEELSRSFNESIPDLYELKATLRAGEGHALERMEDFKSEIEDLDNLTTLVQNIGTVLKEELE